MHIYVLIAISLLASCKEKEQDCFTLPAGAGLTFRIVDTSGNDLLYADPQYPGVSQPCRDDSLITHFRNYRIPGRTDSGTVMTFGNLLTPEPGVSGTCYRIYINWVGDQDTIDWHYRIELLNECKIQVIDYMSFNGLQAKKKNDYAQEYYELTKR